MAVLNIPIKGQIGIDVTREEVETRINNNPDAEEIILEIDSAGGDVLVGYSIFNLLMNTHKKIKANIVGACASITSLIAMTAKRKDTIMNKVGIYVIHNPTVGAEGDSDTLGAAKETLIKVEDTMAELYAERMGITEKQARDKMKVETQFTPEEAKKAKLIGEVVEKQELKAVAFVKDISSLNQKDKTLIEKLAEELKVIKDKLFAKPKAALNLTLTDGGTIYVNTEAESPAVGDAVFTDATMAEVVKPGDYTLEDGRIVVVDSEGVISEVKASTDTEEMKELENKIKELQAEVKKVSDKNKELTGDRNKLIELKAKFEDVTNPPNVDYGLMSEGADHPLDELAGSIKRKFS